MHGRRRLAEIAAIAAIAAAAIAAPPAHADGEDDPSFDADGSVYVPVGPQPGQPNFANGHVLVARATGTDLFVATSISSYGGPAPPADSELRVVRLNNDASLDTGWGGDAIAQAFYRTGNNLGQGPFDLRATPGGGAVALGATADPPAGLVYARFDPSGNAITGPGQLASETAWRAAPPSGCGGPTFARILANGDIVVVWSCNEPGRTRVQRYTWSASSGLTAVHGASGVAIQANGSELFPADVALSQAGALTIFGGLQTSGLPVLVRLTPQDGFDNGFSGDGVVRLADDPKFASTMPSSIGLGPNNEAVVAFRRVQSARDAPRPWHLARFTSGGGLDGTFDGDGVTEINHPAIQCPEPQGVLVLPNNGIVLARDRWADGPCADTAVVARLTPGGSLDPAFDGDGVRTFGFPNTTLTSIQDPLLFDDGKIVLPYSASKFTPARITSPGQDGVSLGVFRLLGPPKPAPIPVTTPQPSPLTPTVVVPSIAPPRIIPPKLAASRRCASRRKFQIRLRSGRGEPKPGEIVSVVVTVNGKRVKATTRGATVNLTKLPKGRFRVGIVVKLSDGTVVRDSRRYRTCAKKVKQRLKKRKTAKRRRS